MDRIYKRVCKEVASVRETSDGRWQTNIDDDSDFVVDQVCHFISFWKNYALACYLLIMEVVRKYAAVLMRGCASRCMH